MRTGNWQVIIALPVTLNVAVAEPLDDFRSDGCSQFPDGTFNQADLWCDCCIVHNIAYWQGGDRKQKQQADESLRDCVLQKTGNTLLAETMYIGVRLGGSPVFPTWYRWGYSWRYGRGFQSLNQYEMEQVKAKLRQYPLNHSLSSCSIEHPLHFLLPRTFDSR